MLRFQNWRRWVKQRSFWFLSGPKRLTSPISEADQLDIIRTVAESLNRAIDLPSTLDTALQLILDLFKFDTGWIFLRNDQGVFYQAAVCRPPPALAQMDLESPQDGLCHCQRMLLRDELAQGMNIIECERLERFREVGTNQDSTEIRRRGEGISKHASIPIRAGGEVIGILNVARAGGKTVSQEELRLLTIIGETLGVAIHRARIYEDLKAARSQEQIALLHFSRSLLREQSPEAVIRVTFDVIGFHVPCDAISLLVPDSFQTSLILIAGRGWTQAYVGKLRLPLEPPTSSAPSWATHTQAPVQEDHTVSDSPFSVPDEVRRAGVQVCLSVPMIAGDRVVGVLVVDRRERRPFTDDQIRFLTVVANLAGTALERAWATRTLNERNRDLQHLIDAIQAITTTFDLKATLQRMVHTVLEMVKAHRGAVYLLDAETGRLSCEYAVGLSPEYIAFVLEHYPHLPGRRVLDEGKPLTVPDVQAISLPDFARSRIEEEGFRAFAVFPLYWKEQVMGALVVYWNKPWALKPHEQELVQTFAHQVAIILQRVREHRALEEAHHRYWSLFEGVPIGLYRSTPDGQILDANPALIRIFGYPDRETLLKQRSESLYVRAEDRKRWQEQIEREGVVRDFEVQMRRYDGRPIWIRETARVVHYEGGQVCYEGVIEDITQQKRAEILHHGERRVLEMIAMGASLSEVFLAIIQAVEEACDGMVGSILLLDEAHRLHVTAAPSLPTSYNEAIEGMPIGPEEGSCGTAAFWDKTVIVTDIATDPLWKKYRDLGLRHGLRACWSVPIRDSEGRVLGTLALYYREPRAPTEFEIDAIRRAAYLAGIAIERHRMESKLRHSRQQLQRLVDTVPDGVILLDTRYRIVLTNPAGRQHLERLGITRLDTPLREMAGYSVEELLCERLGDICELVVKDVEGRRVVFEVVGRAIADPEPQGWVLVLRDVTRLREIQDRAQEQDRLAAIGQLAAGIAHDFNNILQAIVGHAEIASIVPNVPTQVRSALQIIRDQSERAAYMIRQILDFARKSIMEPKPVDLVPFLREYEGFIRRLLPENIKLRMKIAPGPLVVQADLGRLQQMLTNLVVNARDAMPRGGTLAIEAGRLQVSPNHPPPLAEMRPGDWIALTVSDTGVGIPPEIRPHIFEPFFTTKEPGQGTGLGLAQVYGIVQQHGGHIDVHSEVNRGTAVTVYLPAVSVRLEREEQTPPPQGKGEWILVVEDDVRVQIVAQAMLESLGYRVTVVGSAREALSLWEEKGDQFTLVIVDLVLPDQPGDELGQILHERSPNVPIVAMTGYPLGSQGPETWRARGFVDWISKPFTIHELAQVLHRHVRSRSPSES